MTIRPSHPPCNAVRLRLLALTILTACSADPLGVPGVGSSSDIDDVADLAFSSAADVAAAPDDLAIDPDLAPPPDQVAGPPDYAFPGCIEPQPPALNFGTVNTGSDSMAQVLMLTNVCKRVVRIVQLEIAGPDKNDFRATGNDSVPFDLLAGFTRDIKLVFRPRAVGKSVAEYVVREDTGPVLRVALTGRGR